MSTFIFAYNFIGESIGDFVVEDRSGPRVATGRNNVDLWLSKGGDLHRSTSSISPILDLPTEVREKLQKNQGSIPDRQRGRDLLK